MVILYAARHQLPVPRLRPVEIAARRCWWLRLAGSGTGPAYRAGLLDQRQGCSVARVPLQHGANVPDGLIPQPRAEQHRGQVHAQRNIIRRCLDCLAQTVEHRLLSGHTVINLIPGRETGQSNAGSYTNAFGPAHSNRQIRACQVPVGWAPVGRLSDWL